MPCISHADLGESHRARRYDCFAAARGYVTSTPNHESAMSESTECAYKPCTCDVQTATAISANGKRFCSERCAEGRGCDHADCNCGEFPEAEPEEPTSKR